MKIKILASTSLVVALLVVMAYQVKAVAITKATISPITHPISSSTPPTPTPVNQ